jgi:hypothetical protein
MSKDSTGFSALSGHQPPSLVEPPCAQIVRMNPENPGGLGKAGRVYAR